MAKDRNTIWVLNRTRRVYFFNYNQPMSPSQASKGVKTYATVNNETFFDSANEVVIKGSINDQIDSFLLIASDAFG